MHRPRHPLACAIFALFAALCGMNAARAVTIGPPQWVGTTTSSTLDEISGLVASRSLTDVFWVHNDSGDSARFYAMSAQGSLLGTFPLSGAPFGDWEDIAIGPKPGGGNYLYLGDIGDNGANRSTITVHRTNEPVTSSGATISSNNYKSLKLRYPGGARDAESMFVDPLSGDLFLLTKRLSVPELYSVPASAFEDASQTVTLTAHGAFPNVPDWATAADISPDGRFILIRSGNPSAGHLFERGADQTIADALLGVGTSFRPGTEAQGEAIGWAADGKSFYTTSEFSGGSSAPVFSYSFSAPPLLPGDYNNDHVVDAADYALWRNHLGEEFELPNESETPGVVTSHDYAVWKAHFGESIGGDAAAAKTGVVPEPGNWLLAVSGCALAVTAMRRKNWRC